MANNPVDQHVGKRLRDRRTLLGITQQQLAEMLGITFQQVQKYEKGANRMGCSRLFDVCNILDVDANYFFDEMSEQVKKHSPAKMLKNDEVNFAGEIEQDEPRDVEIQVHPHHRGYHS